MADHPDPQLAFSADEIADSIRFARPPEPGLGSTVFLVGAGCSVSAGIPTVETIARRMVKDTAARLEDCSADATETACYEALVVSKRLPDCRKPTTGTSFDAIDWHRVYDEMFKSRYKAPDHVRELFGKLLAEAGGAINWAHLCLGELVARRYISTVLTTNFDQLALSGMVRAGVIPVVCDDIDALNRINGKPQHPQLVEVHGSRHTYLLRNAPADVEAVGGSAQASGTVYELMRHATTFVVVGYGGREAGVMDLLIQAAQSFRDKNLYWVTYSPRPDDINDKVRAFLATSRHARLLPGQDADHFFLDLCRAMKVGPPSALVRPLDSMERLVRDISHHPAKDPDIQAEIEAARRRLHRLRELDERTLDADPIAAIVTRIRERRLSGDHAEAYRLALEAMQ